MKNILKLNDIIKERFFIDELRGIKSDLEEIIISAANIDNIFRTLNRLRIKEIKIDFETMFLIAQFVLANIPYEMICEKDGEIEHDYNKKNVKLALELIQKCKLSKYFGIKLILIN